MSITVTPHLNFRGTARAALGFYAGVFGGEQVVATHAQAYGTTDPAESDLVAWGQVEASNGFRIMAFDVPARMDYDPGVIPLFVAVRGADAGEIADLWSRLVEGSEVVDPLAPAQWAPLYGQLVDPFGVTWVLDVAVAWDGQGA